jgi:putative MATE family efflux protein
MHNAVSLTENIEADDAVKIRRMVMLLAWPAIVEMFLATLVQFVDTAMVGSLGQVAIAAVGISTTPMWIFMSLFSALGVGATALVARYVGAQNPDAANRVAQQAMLMGVTLSLLLTGAVLSYAEFVPSIMGADAAVIPEAASYLRIVSVAFLFAFSSFILSGVLRGAGDTKTPMKINAYANIVNVVFNFLLIFPSRALSFNLPFSGDLVLISIPGAGMGVAGAALATAISRVFAGGIIFYILFSGSKGVKLTMYWKYHWGIIRRILRVGLPAMGERLIISIGHMFFGIIVLGLGTTAYAAHHLAIIAESISYMPGFGFSMAATTLVGQGLGAGNPKLAESYGYATWRLCSWVMGAMAIVLFVFPEYLIGIFNREPEVVALGAMCLRLIAFAQLPFAGIMVLTGALRGAGDTIWPLVIAAIGMWVVRLSLAWVLVTYFHMGLMGAWLAMLLDFWVRGFLTFLRFRSGKWQHIKV